MAQLTTFVFTDLVGSVELKQRMPGVDAAERDAAYVERVLQPHRERIEAGLSQAGGRVVSTAGDGHFLVFPDSTRAAVWAIGVIRSHAGEGTLASGGPPPLAASVRIGMHAGEPQPDPSDSNNYIGRAVDYAARLADYAEGGQILLSRTTAALIEDGAPDGVRLHSHGEHELRGIGSIELYELLSQGQTPTQPLNSPGDPGVREWSVLPHTMGLTEYAAQSGSRGGSRASDSTTSVATTAPPRRVGNYELGELLGSGGMGNVYKARHAQFNRPRAVKIIRPELVDSGGDSVVNRFYQEVRATGSLEHPNLVVAIDSSSPTDEEHFLVMEYIDGVSLDKMLRETGPMSVADACEVARQAALGLEHLHEQGLVHRDVKPSNLMLTLANSPHLPIGTASGRRASEGSGASLGSRAVKLPVVKLMDLGLALLAPGDGERLTRMDRGGMGTGHYMSPEQWRTTSVDIRADLYSLGCTLYHLLTGEPPFARSDFKVERAHATLRPEPLSPDLGAPPALLGLVSRMLAKDPADRPQTPLEVAETLEPIAADHRLAERIKSLRGEPNGSKTQRPDRTDTRPEPADSVETNVLGGRPLSLPEPSSLGGSRTSWLITAVATVVACGAVLALAMARVGASNEALLKSNAGLTARDMVSAIDKRIDSLEAAAANDKPRDLLPPPGSEADLDTDQVQQLQAWLTAQRDTRDDKLGYRSNSWFLMDANGTQIARAPESASIGEYYGYRDYFHGQGQDLPKDDRGAAPIREPHRSAVYESSSRRGELKVAFSVPVYGRRTTGPAPVLGVLAMSVALGDFAEFNEIEANTGEVEIVLADTGIDFVEEAPREGLLLHHRDLASHSRSDRPLRVGPALLSQIKRQSGSMRGVSLEAYRDLLGREGTAYAGAFAVVRPKSMPSDNRAPWVVIAQKPTP